VLRLHLDDPEAHGATSSLRPDGTLDEHAQTFLFMYGSDGSDSEVENHDPSEKRSRTSDWPLKTRNDDHTILDQWDFPARRQCKAPDNRSSRFIEGSMNDKRSHAPDPSYVEGRGDLNGVSEFGHNWASMSMHGRQNSEAQSASTTRAQGSRPSSIIRFGKSIASAFNPSTWKIWSKTEDEDERQDKTATIRKQKAEEVYRELTRTGQISKGVLMPVTHRPYHRERQPKTTAAVDSAQRDAVGAVVGTPMEQKRYGRIFSETSGLPPITPNEMGHADAARPQNGRPGEIRKSSSSNRLWSRAARGYSQSVDDLSVTAIPYHSVPSRKELVKQQRLVKRVSDLEGKLEAARRQLAEALAEPLPPPPGVTIGSHTGSRSFSNVSTSRLPAVRSGAYNDSIETSGRGTGHVAAPSGDAPPASKKRKSTEHDIAPGVLERAFSQESGAKSVPSRTPQPVAPSNVVRSRKLQRVEPVDVDMEVEVSDVVEARTGFENTGRADENVQQSPRPQRGVHRRRKAAPSSGGGGMTGQVQPSVDKATAQLTAPMSPEAAAVADSADRGVIAHGSPFLDVLPLPRDISGMVISGGRNATTEPKKRAQADDQKAAHQSGTPPKKTRVARNGRSKVRDSLEWPADVF
jgi:hypothetical protein